MNKIEFWYDFETTGLKIEEGCCCTISYQIVENGVVKFEGNEFINPLQRKTISISAEALRINGRNERNLSHLKP